MTLMAGITYLFFTLYLFIHAPQLALHEKRPMASQQATLTQSVTATLALSTTHQAQGQLKTNDLYRRVAARSLGEGSFAVAEIACTIKNRLRVSKAPLNRVLRAYYARDRTPQAEHIEIVRKVFEGELPCPETWWYALSPADTRRFRPHLHPAMVVTRDPRSQIWIYDH